MLYGFEKISLKPNYMYLHKIQAFISLVFSIIKPKDNFCFVKRYKPQL